MEKKYTVTLTTAEEHSAICADDIQSVLESHFVDEIIVSVEEAK